MPDYDLSGLHWPWDDAWDLWRAWADHGVMPESGGYLDQPPEWRAMIRTFQAVYSVVAHDIKREVHARKRNRP